MPKVDIRNLDTYNDDRNSSPKQKIRKSKRDDDGDYQKKKK